MMQIPFGHRLGRNPQVVMSTTPKPRAVLRDLQEKARAYAALQGLQNVKRWDRVVVTQATTDDNPALEEEVREGLYDLYAGTRLGRQELEGILLEDFEGALWNRDDIVANSLLHEDLPTLGNRIVGIDPSGWGVKVLETGIVPPPGEIGRGVETGIVVSALDSRRDVYTLGDYSGRMTPNDWANAAIDAYVRWKCRRMAPETNFGGPLVIANVKAAEQRRRIDGEDLPPINVLGVRASDGKRVRAEPVAGLTEQGRHHFVGLDGLALLVDQCCGWDPNEAWSPDRLDAMVHGVTALEPWQTATPTTMAVRRRGRVPRI
jgi:phage terminase large subunit-like protein